MELVIKVDDIKKGENFRVYTQSFQYMCAYKFPRREGNRF